MLPREKLAKHDMQRMHNKQARTECKGEAKDGAKGGVKGWKKKK